MKIALSVGHSILKNGNITSANGFVNEYKYNKDLANYLVKYLKELDCDVDLIICPEKKFTKASEESTYKLNRINKAEKYDLVVELHLNASSPLANGTEVLYVSETGRFYAEKIQLKLSSIFKNRGIKKRNDLYMLTKTKPVAIIIESFFCTNKDDCKKGEDKDKIARLIAEAITNKKISNSNLYRVTADVLNIRAGAGTQNKIKGQIKDKGTYTITEKKGNWGKLKSGAGWICLDYCKKV